MYLLQEALGWAVDGPWWKGCAIPANVCIYCTKYFGVHVRVRVQNRLWVVGRAALRVVGIIACFSWGDGGGGGRVERRGVNFGERTWSRASS